MADVIDMSEKLNNGALRTPEQAENTINQMLSFD